MEETRFIKVIGKYSLDLIVLPVSAIKEVFADNDGTFIVIDEFSKKNCRGYYVCETLLEIADKLGAR